MSFQFADLFVQVSVRGVKATQNSIGTLRAQLGEFSPLLGGLQLMSAAWLATLALGTGLIIKEFSQAEEMAMEFDAALTNVGQNTKEVHDTFSAFADDIQSKTVLDNDAVLGLAASALKLGASLQDVQTIVKAGIGLGEMFFGGNAAEGVKVLTLAQQGNYRELQRLIPELKGMKDHQAMLNIVMEKSRQGLEFAKARTQTFRGELERLRVAVGNAAESIGKQLVPYLERGVEFFHRISLMVEQMSDAQKEAVIRIAAVSAGIAGLIMFGPPVIAFFGSIGQAALAAIKIISSGFLFLATTPLGWFITALAGVATALAYVVGEGEKTTDRIGDGFLKIVSYLDPMLGSFEGFTSGMKTLWNLLISHITDVFIGFKTYFLNVWESISEAVEQIWWSMFGRLNQGWQILKYGAMAAMTWLRNAWEQTTDTIANKFAYAMQYMDVESEYRRNHPGAREEDVQQAIQKEMKIRADYLDKQTNDAKAQHQKEFEQRMSHIGDEYTKQSEYMQKQIQDQSNLDKARRQKNRDENDRLGQEQIESNRKQREADWNDQMKKFKELPKLSTEIANLYKKIRSGMGLDQLQKDLDDLYKKFQKLVVKPGDITDGNQDLSLQSTSAGGGNLKTTSLEEAFKRTLAGVTIGQDLAAMEREQRRQAEAERKKQHDKTNRTLDDISQKLDLIGQTAGMS